MIKSRAASSSLHELTHIDQSGPCPFHCADAEENIAEGRVPLIGYAFRQNDSAVILEPDLTRNFLRKCAGIREDDFGAGT